MTAIKPDWLPDNSVPQTAEVEQFAPARRAPQKLGDVDHAANVFEGEIRDFVRRDVTYLRRQHSAAAPAEESAADNLSAAIRRVSGASMEEIDRVILELQGVRELLRKEGERVNREIAGYASLSHTAMTAMRVIGDGLQQWRDGPTPPSRDRRPAG
jgi:hypothetical protein